MARWRWNWFGGWVCRYCWEAERRPRIFVSAETLAEHYELNHPEKPGAAQYLRGLHKGRQRP